MALVDTLKLVASKVLGVAVFLVLCLATTVAYMVVTKAPVSHFTSLAGFSFVAGVLGWKGAAAGQALTAWLKKLLKLPA